MFSLILPTYNEAANIAECIRRVEKVLHGQEFEIIVVDDDSPDLTWKIAKDLTSSHVTVVRRKGARGLSGAVREGFKYASGDFVGVMDADLQHDEAVLPSFIEQLKDHDLVVGSRAVQGGSAASMSIGRRMMSLFGAFVANSAISLPLSDPMSGFFALRRTLLKNVESKLSKFPGRDYKILLQILALSGPIQYKEVGYKFRERGGGESKLNFITLVAFLQFLLIAKTHGQVRSTTIIEVDVDLPKCQSLHKSQSAVSK